MTVSTLSASAPKPSGKSLANGLGWFSISLGLVELLAPKPLARNLGMEGQEKLLQAYGVRELGVGLGILAATDPAPWIKGRIAGDLLDLGSLALQMRPSNPCMGQVGLALGMVAGITALDVYCVRKLQDDERQARVQKWDYRDRSGWSRPPEAMRGIAREVMVQARPTSQAMQPF